MTLNELQGKIAEIVAKLPQQNATQIYVATQLQEKIVQKTFNWDGKSATVGSAFNIFVNVDENRMDDALTRAKNFLAEILALNGKEIEAFGQKWQLYIIVAKWRNNIRFIFQLRQKSSSSRKRAPSTIDEL